MAQEKVYAIPNVPTPNTPVIIDDEICTGCNECVDVCQMDIFIPNPEAGKPPIVLHPEECWYGGDCVFVCPSGAITFHWPLNQSVAWKRKATGEYFHLGAPLNT